MGGPATFSGTNYQVGVTAYVLVHLLVMRPLGWTLAFDDTPLAVSGETLGPGDDIRVDCRRGRTFEIQAKAGLEGATRFEAAITGILARAAPSDDVVLVVDRRSSKWIYGDAATELERIRSGRADSLTHLAGLHGIHGSMVGAVRIKAADVDPPDDIEAARAKDLLVGVLASPTDASQVWNLLRVRASDIAARRLRVDRSALLDLLESQGIRLATESPDDRWIQQLDVVGQLLERWQGAAVLPIIDRIEQALVGESVGPRVRYLIARHRAVAYIQVERHHEGLASAELALDLEPTGVEALTAAASASRLLGDTSRAKHYAERAVAADTESPRAWASLAVSSAEAGEALRQPPAAIERSTRYRTTLAEIALVQGQPDTALELTALIMREGERTPDALFLRAAALFSSVGPTEQVGVADEVERLSTEAIDGLDDVHPFKARALALRAIARRTTGDAAGAEHDARQAAAIDPRDTAVLRQLATVRLSLDDDEGALQLLNRPAAEEEAVLLAMRSQVHTRMGRSDEARRDLDRAMSHVADSMDPQDARLLSAEAALDLDDVDSAQAMLSGTTRVTAQSPMANVLAGRVAFARGSVEDGVASYRAAAASDPGSRMVIMAELAVALGRVGRDAEGIEVMRELDRAGLPEAPRQAFVRMLMRVEDLEGADQEIRDIAGGGELPVWAVAVAVDIALRREDPDAAILRLLELVDRGHATPSVRLALARTLIEVDRLPDAGVQVDLLVSDDTLTGHGRAQVAGLLRELGRGIEAVEQAYAAYRLEPDEADMHRVLMGMVFASRIELPPVDTVGPETTVRLTDEHGVPRSHTILSEEPIRARLDEISVESATELGLIGLRVGDEVVEHPDTPWRSRRSRVVAIVPAAVGAAQDALQHYEDRFGPEPFVVTSIHVGDGDRLDDYSRVIQALAERRTDAEKILDLVRVQGLPLGFVARALGTSEADLMNALLSGELGPPSLMVEWEDAARRAWSAERGRDTTVLVVTRSALRTMLEFDLAPIVTRGYELMGPRSLVAELRGELKVAREELAHGRTSMSAGGPGMQLHEVPAGHSVLQASLERSEAALTFATDSMRIEARPLRLISSDDSSPTSLRQRMGPSSHDALGLVQEFDGVLWADDLGLRRFAPTGEFAPSVSSVSLLPTLAEKGLIDGKVRDRLLTALAAQGYAPVAASPGLLLEALRNATLSADQVKRVFSVLGSRLHEPDEAAKITASACRAAALEAIRTVAVERIAEQAIDAISARVPRRTASSLVLREAERALALLPMDLRLVRDVCLRVSGR